MKERDRLARNETRLHELYPAFRARVERVIIALEPAGIRPRIQDAWRSPADQMAAFNQGTSKLRYGFHNVTDRNGEPEALAVDLLDDNAPLNPSISYLLQLAEAAEEHGLITGIRWGLPGHFQDTINAAITNKEWLSPVKVGWDPCHLQICGITIAEARRGVRPP